MFDNKKIFLILFFFINIFPVGILQRFKNILQGPIPYIIQNHKDVKKGIKEPFYWFTNSTNESLDAAICHEVAHTLVGYNLGFRITETSVYKHMILRFAYIGKTVFELEKFKELNKNEIDKEVLKKLDSDVLKNIICLALAGGLGTEIVYGHDYGMSGDDQMINFIGVELIKRENDSLLDKILLNTRDFSFISNLDFKEKIKEMRKECYKKTKEILVDNLETLDFLRNELKNRPDKTLSEDMIKEIIDSKKEEPR